ncbi:hypothetical protein O1611_g8638 [Lasiodiplodia mahajangana]|uniref:Uncharacterized protein n=1 Tax=Lasiodiplodia mahajangana TaxID=1108764 RepID=A0ACC2JBX3_9PEZI|nr:hypothetical protein O1611_g8638 [Lasiodiplodia mahajangana]
MAELALLGLVANIFQFIELGINIVSTARDVYQCVESFQSTEIRLLLEDIRNTSNEVGRLSGQSSVWLCHDELAIRSYSAECDSVAAELSSLAAKLTRNDGAKSRTLDGVRDLDKNVRQRLERVLNKQVDMAREGQFCSIMAIIDRLDKRGFDLEVSTAKVLDKSRELLRQQLTTDHRVGPQGYFLLGVRTVTYKFPVLAPARRCDLLDKWLGWEWQVDADEVYLRRPKTRDLLAVWKGDNKLVTAIFCFWALGTPMQKSPLGLLQSLMFQILRTDSTLAAALFPNKRSREPWTVSELREAFRRVPELISGKTKFCFFIDGLDEYPGNETDLIEIVDDISSSSSIKICVSSRPWNRFREAYSSCPSIAVEHLTKNDILNYIKAELLASDAFQENLSADARCGTIIPQLVLQSRGVFLWVFLVVRSLKRDLKSREPYEHLQLRINEIPQSLEGYFQRIFDRIDTIYRQQTARLFLIALHLEEHNENSFPLVAYSCIETEVRDPRYAVDQPLIARDPSWIRRIPDYLAGLKKLAVTRLDDRCKDLLQPRTNDSWHPDSIHYIHISLLHRTVRDFLRDNYLDSLKDRAGENFSPEDSIAKSFLWLFKTYPTQIFFAPAPGDKMTDMSIERRSRMVLLQFWTHVTNHESHISDETIYSFFETMTSLYGTDWVGMIVDERVSRYLTYPSHLTMIPWAVFLNLTGYVQRNWKAGSAEGHFDYEVLTLLLALQPRFLKGSDDIEAKRAIPITPPTVTALCELGCNPNDREIGTNFLNAFQRYYDVEAGTLFKRLEEAYVSKQNVFEVTKVLFQHGLRIPATLREREGVCKANFSYLFEPIFGIDGVRELQRLRGEFQSRWTWSDRLLATFGLL